MSSQPAPAKILIVDDHPIVRQGVKAVLNREADLEVCCEANNADEAMRALANCQHQLAIIDLSLEGESGLSLIAALAARHPRLSILVMSMHEESQYAERVLRLGAKGYITKQQAVLNIQAAVRWILDGEIYLGSDMQKLIMQRMASSPDTSASDPAAALTNKEFEVLRLIGFGLSTRQIAEKTNRSIKTIETHCANIKLKLGIRTGRELVRFAAVWVKGAQ